MTVQAINRRIYEILERASADDKASNRFDIFLVTLIALNVIAVILESVKTISTQYQVYFYWLEILSVAVFSIEYVLRVWSCTATTVYANPITGRIRFALTPLAIVDLLAILPFYLSFIPLDLRFLRFLRVFRIFRLTKLVRYSTALQALSRVLVTRKYELFVSIFVMFILLVVASSLMYYAEYESQPEAFSSIPAAMWWAVATLTTVGYGDVYPVTQLGKIMASIVAILGIGMFALPTGIVGAGFVEEVQRQKSESETCPHCGKLLKK